MNDRDARRVRDRKAGLRLEQVMVATPRELEIALVVARTENRLARFQFDDAEHARSAGVAYADSPPAAAFRSDDLQISTGLDERVRDAVFPHQSDRSGECCTLRDAAEGEFDRDRGMHDPGIDAQFRATGG